MLKQYWSSISVIGEFVILQTFSISTEFCTYWTIVATSLHMKSLHVLKHSCFIFVFIATSFALPATFRPYHLGLNCFVD